MILWIFSDPYKELRLEDLHLSSSLTTKRTEERRMRERESLWSLIVFPTTTTIFVQLPTLAQGISITENRGEELSYLLYLLR